MQAKGWRSRDGSVGIVRPLQFRLQVEQHEKKTISVATHGDEGHCPLGFFRRREDHTFEAHLEGEQQSASK